jgi:hypothetical protein
MMFRAMQLVVLVCGLGLATADADPGKQVLAETDAAKIVSQQTEIHQDVLARRGPYRDMAESERARLLELQQGVIGALEGRARTTELPAAAQVSLFNDLEAISALVNKAEDERMVCERTRPIGSNRPVNICKTVAERRLEREQSLEGRRRDSRCMTACGDKIATEGW